MRITIRLSDEEHAQLKALVERNETTGFENPSEFFRLMIAREYNKGRGLPKPKANDWQTAARIGRPRAGSEKPWQPINHDSQSPTFAQDNRMKNPEDLPGAF